MNNVIESYWDDSALTFFTRAAKLKLNTTLFMIGFHRLESLATDVMKAYKVPCQLK